MKLLKYMLLALLMTAQHTAAEARSIQVPHVYLFGFSASFKDSVIYITDIQDARQAWIDSKTKFLLGRDNYSYQLKDYLSATLGQPDRICMVFYATTKRKIEKQYQKLKRKYTGKGKRNTNYDVKFIDDFTFTVVDMSPEQQ